MTVFKCLINSRGNAIGGEALEGHCSRGSVCGGMLREKSYTRQDTAAASQYVARVYTGKQQTTSFTSRGCKQRTKYREHKALKTPNTIKKVKYGTWICIARPHALSKMRKKLQLSSERH